jgi:hypothetical protein
VDYSTFCLLGTAVFGANMGCKLPIAPLLVVLFHFIERITGGRSGSIEHPRTLGATPAPKTLFFDPDQFAAHGLAKTPRKQVR